MGVGAGPGRRGAGNPWRAGPCFPPGESADLFAALANHDSGASGAIERWHRDLHPLFLAALRRWAPSTVDAEDIWQELELEAFRAVRRGMPPDVPAGWLSRVSVHLLCRRLRRREATRLEGGVPLEELPGSVPSPLDSVAEEDGAHALRGRILEAARLLPRPHGHVLCWRFLQGVPWREVLALLNLHRPQGAAAIAGRRARRIIEDARTMAVAILVDGKDPRSIHPHVYLPGKNRWMCAPLPLLPALGDPRSPHGAGPDGSRTPGRVPSVGTGAGRVRAPDLRSTVPPARASSGKGGMP